MNNFRKRLAEVLDYAETNLVVIGLLGLVGFPLFFLVWSYWFPQPYENLGLRLFCSLLFAPWVFYRVFFFRYKSFFSVYFFLSSLISMPFFFSFMLLKNEFSIVWAMSYITGLCLLIIIVYDWILVSIMVVSGLTLAYGLEWINGNTVHLQNFQPEYIPIYLFALIACTLASYRRKADQQLKIKLTRSLAGSIAHEMRNPLAQIHGNLYLIEELQKQIPYLYGAKPIVAEHIKNAQRVIQSGLQVIDITMDAIADRPVNIHNFQPLSAKALVEEAVADYAYERVEHSKRISVQGEDFELKAEPVMVKYVLYNLIQNALWYIKTLPDAEMVISLKPSQQGPNQIEVRDTGPGIATDAIPKLFDSFYTSGKEGGSGLGLSYCKRTMVALGGDIRCKSELGQYTAFTLFFPVVSAPQQRTIIDRPQEPHNREQHHRDQEQVPQVAFTKRAPQSPISLLTKTILLAEDDILSRRIVKAMLEKQGINCLEAENGQVALDLLRSQSCDLIITDIHMPLIDGLALIQTVREQQTTACATNQPIPIIAITADSGDKLHTALQIGACDYLSKPVTRDKLVPKLQQWLVA